MKKKRSASVPAVLALFCILVTGCTVPNDTLDSSDSNLVSSSFDSSESDTTDSTFASTEETTDEPVAAIPETDSFDFKDYVQVNHSSAGRVCQDGDEIFYMNVYDEMLLTKYNMKTGQVQLLTDEVGRVQYITTKGDRVYFSAIPRDQSLPHKYNVYSIDKNGGDLTLEVEIAHGSIFIGDYMYFNDSLDDFISGVYRKNMTTGEITEVISVKYECDHMNINIVGDYMYARAYYIMLKVNLNTLEIEEIPTTDYDYAMAKMQYFGGNLYYYAYGEVYGEQWSVRKQNPLTDERESLFTINNGDFWGNALLVTSDYIFVSGMFTSPDNGEDINDRRGTYRYSFASGEVEKICESVIYTSYIVDNKILALNSSDEVEFPFLAIYDFDGNKLDESYPSLVWTKDSIDAAGI
ncbi:hypothetical protein FACS1894105_08390 [Clostridia bacterium]|nr:hypothetical protein FACS1894105_08390 [Clostridia bacterium]